MNRAAFLTAIVCIVRMTCSAAEPEPAARPADADNIGGSISDVYEGLASGALTHARLAELPEGTILRSGELEITQKNVAAEIAKAPSNIQEQLKKNTFFLLEQMATPRLLLAEANAKLAKDGQDLSGKDDTAIIQEYLETLTAKSSVSETEITAFYEQNKEMMGGATLEQVKSDISQYLLQQKKQQVIGEYIVGLGQRAPIEVAADWVKEQAALAKDNPVDNARSSGKPSLVDFGASGCRPCDMMAPILDTLKKKYAGKLNVLFVHVREDQILAARYGVGTIPSQLFFDKDGKEVFRHVGFFAEEQIEAQLKTMGIE